MRHALTLILASLAFFALAAIAQSAPTATLTWGAVTTYTDGTTIPSTSPVTYNVYQSCTSATTLTLVASGVTALTTSITTGLSDGETCYWAVAAVANAIIGAQSNVANKVFAAGTPGTVTLTVK